MLKEQQFMVQMGHQPLVNTSTKNGDCWSEWQQCHLFAITEFSSTIVHLKGSSNNVTDTLSRNTINGVQIRISYPEISAAQKHDVVLQRLRRENHTLTWIDFATDDEKTTIGCEMSTGRPRRYLPLALRRKAFNLAHHLSHLSGHITTRILSEQYILRAMNLDIKKWARECFPCQTSKVMKRIRARTINYNRLTTCPHSHRHWGPLPHSKGTDTPTRSNRPEYQMGRCNICQTADSRKLCESSINWVSQSQYIISNRGS
ncbi:uncharacterized protein [Macrobrachium rosenbergii]|uniref:uncharacterized protein n=1 Tax=Macrobrachium rosenbergii TaxID=79674 RepID=UPI0034D4883F